MHYVFYYIIPCYLFVILLIINVLLFDCVDYFSYLYKIY
ncbi:putative membrane protein [Phocaeicola vulgatus str. 3775 SL(B) 10 (iv)]|uniref:Putative membrane protein n=1 Tax=Phocaeicola vulgatus str. 3775 SL(B) 10 (iv) TaxID=1339350 RepID=A0A078QRD2_PHOVU|nr:putative membrane protein [Phocaeicola vulgatus str. 3775 SL(B) 10 (iv)]KDS39604.1 putative membrane protein [Phocaeicola vulgatus str. 3775 SR(B) 19]